MKLFLAWCLAICLTFTSGICFGIQHQQNRENIAFMEHYSNLTRYYESRIEWLSKGLDGTKKMLNDELWEIRLDYMEYKYLGRQVK